jgi:hypothetical protein
MFLYLKQVNKILAFVCVVRDEVFSENRGIMDYNLTLFKDSVKDILASQNAVNTSKQDSSGNLVNSMINNLSINGN